MARILLALKESAARKAVESLLLAQGHGVDGVQAAEAALEHLVGPSQVDAVVTDIWHPGAHGAGWVARIMAARPSASVLVLFHPTEHAVAVECLKAGAADILLAPPHPDELALRVWRAVGMGGGANAARVEELQRALGDASAELKRAQDARAGLETTLLRHAMVDPLTGLSNRRVFEERLAAEHGRARRFGRPLSVVLLDVDHADRAEQHFGSETFQEALRLMGQFLREGLRETDVAARVDDDEFGLLLVETPLGGAREVAVELKRAIGSASYPQAGRMTVSGGVVSLDPNLHKEPAVLWEAARTLLKRAKEAGRDRVEG